MTIAEPTPRYEVTAIGESMLRLSVPLGERLEDMRDLRAFVGGAESNVLAALAGLGRKVAWHGRLPDNALGRSVLKQLRAAGIDTGRTLLHEGGRLGLYFFEPGSTPRSGNVVYDRANSSFSQMSPEDVAWDDLLDTRILHLTGITPALGDNGREIAQQAIERARARNVPVSFDVNYRRKLWPAKRAAETLQPLMSASNLVLCGLSDARELFGLDGDPTKVLGQLSGLCPNGDVVLTCGADGAIACVKGRVIEVPVVEAQVVDPLGAGDAFAAGVIDGWLDGSLDAGLSRGAMLASLALAQVGDMVTVSRPELEKLLDSREGVRIHR